MTIKEAMQFGCDGMTEQEIVEETVRRLKVIEKINAMGELITRLDVQIVLLPADYNAVKIFKRRKRNTIKKLNRIKADESIWLRQAAWFMYT